MTPSLAYIQRRIKASLWSIENFNDFIACIHTTKISKASLWSIGNFRDFIGCILTKNKSFFGVSRIFVTSSLALCGILLHQTTTYIFDQFISTCQFIYFRILTSSQYLWPNIFLNTSWERYTTRYKINAHPSLLEFFTMETITRLISIQIHVLLFLLLVLSSTVQLVSSFPKNINQSGSSLETVDPSTVLSTPLTTTTKTIIGKSVNYFSFRCLI